MAEPTASVTFDRQRHRVYVRMEMDEDQYEAMAGALLLAPGMFDTGALLKDAEREKSDQSGIMDRFDPPDVEIRRENSR